MGGGGGVGGGGQRGGEYTFKGPIFVYSKSRTGPNGVNREVGLARR